MPVTLAQAALNATSDIDVAVINEFRVNTLMDLVTFDDCVNPAGGGATLTYGYQRQVSTGNAAFRAVNTEYTPAEVTKARYTVDLKPLGGSFQIDRVLANIGSAANAEVAFQLSDKVRATYAKFGDAVINGDTTVDANGFDGLSKALAGSSTEDTTLIDLSAGVTDMASAFKVLTVLDDLLSRLDGDATAVIANKKLINLFKAAARFSSQFTREPGPRGSYLTRYGDGGPLLLEAGNKPGGTTDVIPVNATDPDSAGPLVAGSTAAFAVRFGLDGFHGVSVAGGQLVTQWLPDFTTSGAVKTGEVEMGPVATVLKRTRAAVVARNIKVQ